MKVNSLQIVCRKKICGQKGNAVDVPKANDQRRWLGHCAWLKKQLPWGREEYILKQRNQKDEWVFQIKEL